MSAPHERSFQRLRNAIPSGPNFHRNQRPVPGFNVRPDAYRLPAANFIPSNSPNPHFAHAPPRMMPAFNAMPALNRPPPNMGPPINRPPPHMGPPGNMGPPANMGPPLHTRPPPNMGPAYVDMVEQKPPGFVDSVSRSYPAQYPVSRQEDVKPGVFLESCSEIGESLDSRFGSCDSRIGESLDSRFGSCDSRMDSSDGDDDDKWVSRWLGGRRRTARRETQATDVKQVKYVLKESLSLLKELEALKENMKSGTTDDAQTAQHIMAKLKSNGSLFTNPDITTMIRKKLHKQKRKRKQIYRKRHRESEEKKKQEETRKMKTAEIDAWLKKTREDQQKKLRDARLGEEADSVLSEVRSKKSEMMTSVQVLTKLRELRRAREHMLAASGVPTSHNTHKTFNNKTDELEKLLVAQLEHYNNEETALSVMMKHDDDDDDVRAEQTDVVMYTRRVLTSLFSHKVQSLHSYTATCNTDHQHLIKTRSEWDAYIVPSEIFEASCVPVGWVLPAAPSSQEWAAYIR